MLGETIFSPFILYRESERGEWGCLRRGGERGTSSLGNGEKKREMEVRREGGSGEVGMCSLRGMSKRLKLLPSSPRGEGGGGGGEGEGGGRGGGEGEGGEGKEEDNKEVSELESGRITIMIKEEERERE